MLQPDKLKKLNENAMQMSQSGSSEDEILAMKDAFIKRFGNEVEVKKKDDFQSDSQPISPEKVWGQKSQPKSVYDTLVTGQQKPVVASAISAGKPKLISYDQYRVDEVKKNLSAIKQKTEQDKIDARQEVVSDFADTGFLNKAATFGKNVWNAIADVNAQGISAVIPGVEQVEQAPDAFRFDIDRSKKFVDAAKKEHQESVKEAIKQKVINKNIQIPSYDPAKIKERAFELAVKEKVGDKVQARINDYMENLPDRYGNDLKQLVADKYGNEYKQSTKEAKNALDVSVMSQKEADDSQLKVNNYANVFSQYKAKGQPVPKEIQAQFLIDSKYNEDIHKQAIKDKDNHSNIVAKNNNLSENIDTFNRDYGFLSNTLKNVTSASLHIGSGILGGVDYVASLEKNIANRIGVHKFDFAFDTASKIAKYSSEKLKKGAEYIESVSEKSAGVEDVNSIGGFGRFAINEVIAKNAPMLGLIATGPVGVGAVVTSSVGETFEGMMEQQEAGEKQYNDLQLYGIPAAKGAVDLVLFTFDGQMLKNAQRVIKAASASQKEIMAKAALEQLLKKPATYKEVGKQILGKQMHGLAVMNGVTISKNIIDIVGGVDPDRSITEGTFDASAASLILVGAMHSVPTISAKIGYEITSDTKGMKLSSQIVSLEKIMNNETLSQETRDALKDQHRKATDKLGVVLKKQVRDIQSLSNDQYKEIVGINKNIVNLKNKAQDVKIDENLSDNMKTQILDGYAEDFIAANKRKGELVSNGAKAQFERLSTEEQDRYYKAAEAKLNKELNPDGTTNEKASTADIIKEAIANKNLEEFEKSKDPLEDVDSELTPTEVLKQGESKKAEVPDWLREEYDGRLAQYEESIATAKKYIEEEKAKGLFLRNRGDIKYYEDEVKYYEDKAKLLRENPVEFYKQDLNEQKKYHEERLNEDPEYKQRLIDDYGTTDFEVIDSYFIENTNGKILDYEAVQKTAEENAKQSQTEPTPTEPTPTELTVNEKELEVERLREEERLEKEDVDPNDKEKLDEIYDRYDKLISPLLREIEAVKEEAIPTEKTQGTPDVISEPIDLEVPKPKVEAPKEEAKSEEKIKGGDKLSTTLLDGKELTYQESFDLANSELKEIESKERTLSVQKEYEAKIKEINRIKELAAKSEVEVKAEEKPFEGEFKFTIDGKEYTQEEAVNRSRRVPFGSKMEYTGTNKQAIEFVNDYNESANPYSNDGKLKGAYIQQELLKAMDNMSFRKFGDLYRKHIDPYFKRSMNEKSVGGKVGKGFTWEENAAYRIGDALSSSFEGSSFRAFAKVAGIKVPEFAPTEKVKVAEEVKPTEVAEPLKDVKSTSKAFDIFPFGKIIKAKLFKLSGVKMPTKTDDYIGDAKDRTTKDKINFSNILLPDGNTIFDRLINLGVRDIELTNFFELFRIKIGNRSIDKTEQFKKDIFNLETEGIDSENISELMDVLNLSKEVSKNMQSQKNREIARDFRDNFDLMVKEGVLDKDLKPLVDEIADSFENNKLINVDSLSDLVSPNQDYNWSNKMSEAYHKAKSNGSNPELVKAVEELLVPKKEQLRKSVDEATKNLQDAYNAFKTIGFALDPKQKAAQDLKNQAALNKALIDYGVAKLKKGTYEFSEFVKDLKTEGIKVSKEFAKEVYERIKNAHAAVSKKESGDRLGIKRTPKEEQAIQAKIDKAYELGAKEQKAISKEIEKSLKLETKETEAQAKDALSAQKEVLGIEKAEALSKQGKKFREEKETIKQSIKDKIEKSKDARKNINQIVAESFKRLKDLKERQVKSILNHSMKIFNYENLDNGIANFVEHIDKIINDVEYQRQVEVKDGLIKDIAKAISPSSLLKKSDANVKKTKITASSKQNLKTFLDGYSNVNFENLDIPELETIKTQIDDIIKNGKAERQHIENQDRIVKDQIERQIPSFLSEKYGNRVQGRFDVADELSKGNYVIVDGKVYKPSDLEFVQDNMPGKQTGELIEVPVNKAEANNDFIKRGGFLKNLKEGKISKAFFGGISEFAKKQNIGHSGIRATFQDLATNKTSMEFLNKNFVIPLELFKNKQIVTYRGFTEPFETLLRKSFGKSEKSHTSLFNIWESELKKKGSTIINKRNEGTYEGKFLTQTELKIELKRKGKSDYNIFENKSNSDVIQLYSELKDPMNVRKFLSDGHTIEDIKKIIDFVHNDPKLNDIANGNKGKGIQSLPDLYKNILPKVNETLDLNGHDTIESKKYISIGDHRLNEYNKAIKAGNSKAEAERIAEEKTAVYSEVLKAFYGENVPEEVPYVPSAVEPTQEADLDVLKQFEDFHNGNSTLLFGNLYGRKEGGSLVLRPFQDVFREYAQNSSRFIEGASSMKNVSNLFLSKANEKLLIKNLGSDWVNLAKNKSIGILTGKSEFDVMKKSDFGNKIGQWTTLKTGVQLVLTPVTMIGQVLGTPNFYMSLENVADRQRYRKIYTDSNLRGKYYKSILNSSLMDERVNKSGYDVDSDMLRKMSNGKSAGIKELSSSLVSDGLILTAISDAAAILYGGIGLYGVEYERNFSEYKKTMSPKEADLKAERDAMIKLFAVAEKTQASSQEAFTGAYLKDPMARILGLYSFQGPSIQMGSLAVESYRDVKAGRVDKVDGLKKIAYFGVIGATLFNAAKLLLPKDDDKVETTGGQLELPNEIFSDILNQFGIIGKQIAILKDEILKSSFPKALGVPYDNSKEKATDKLIRILGQESPAFGATVRTFKKVLDAKDEYSAYRQAGALAETVGLFPADKVNNIATRAIELFDTDFKWADRVKILTGVMNETSMLKYKSEVDKIQKMSVTPEVKGMSYNERIAYSKLKGQEAIDFKNSIEQENQLEFIERRMSILKENGIGYESEISRINAEVSRTKNSIIEDYIKPAIEANGNNDIEKAKKINDDFIAMTVDMQKNNPEMYANLEKSLQGMIDNVASQSSSFINDIKKASIGRARAMSIYSKFGDLLDPKDRLDSVSINLLDEAKLLDKVTVDAYKKMVSEQKLKKNK